MQLAREFNRPDWRRMLASMSCTELGEWMVHMQDHPFSHALLDAEFSQLNYTLVKLAAPEADVLHADFSLLQQSVETEEQDEEEMMAMAEGIAGGTRFVAPAVSGEESESEGVMVSGCNIAGGVRYG